MTILIHFILYTKLFLDFKSKLVTGSAQYAKITPREDDNLAFFFAGFDSLCWLSLSIIGDQGPGSLQQTAVA